MYILIELMGIFFFAVAGSLMAARRGFDLLGSAFLGGVCGLGGGVVRDLILNQSPATFAHPVYFVPPVLAALCVYAFTPAVQKLHRLVQLFDAAGLGLFCVTGTLKALEHDFNQVTAVLLGVITSVGGGLMRDVISNVTPDLFNPRDIYALAAMVGAVLTAVAWHLGLMNVPVGAGIAALAFAIRVASIRFGWSVPLAAGHWHRSRPTPPCSEGPQRHF
ncbi:TRIC cation channel family protein [Arthrobacter sp. JUb115]|uniref:trimeric intracellular cation channel family protein n=1 Tax=Arthrobacter sp. JUb115 TaxID=2485108 RepID=UPI00105F5A30|nr:TRIC cation channel family protein [Arthrobacter sp. JUb115]TDU20567.1 putative membrane protein YeiH [Arthrobacter sp. JUb115]